MSPHGSITTMRYRDPKVAINWLCKALGFTRHMIAEDATGNVVHAQLTLGHCMVMLGPTGTDGYDALVCQPDEAGGLITQAPYIIIEDPNAHCRVARDAGAEIVLGPTEDDGRGLMYTCRDPEGHIWNFGEYDPWATVR